MSDRRQVTEADDLRLLDCYHAVEVRSGGMADVYICEPVHDEFEGRRAIKIPKSWVSFGKETWTQWIYECYSWVRLGRHPNIVAIDRVFMTGGTPQLVMEYVENSLRDLLSTGPLDQKRALSYAVNICDALTHATTVIPSLVHRDLKPENVLISDSGAAKVSDFGLITVDTRNIDLSELRDTRQLARREPMAQTAAVVRDDPLVKRVGVGAGTPAYMSPEQVRQTRPLDQRSDIYSLGCILYEMLVGQRVFQARDVSGYLQCHLEKDPVAPHERSRAIPQVLSLTVLNCLSKNPDDRVPSWASLGVRLRQIARDEYGLRVDAPRPEPLSDQDLFSIADSLYKLGAYEKAREVCADYRGDAWWKCHLLSHIHLEEGEYDLALQGFEQLSEKADEAVTKTLSLEGIGLTYKRMGQFGKALEYFEREALATPSFAVPQLHIAQTRHAIGDIEGAISSYRRALELAGDPRVYVEFAMMLINERRFDEAITRLTEALVAYEDNVQLQLLLAHAFTVRIADCLQHRRPLVPSMLREVRIARNIAIRYLRVDYLSEAAALTLQLADRLIPLLRT